MRFPGPEKRVVIIHHLEDNLEATGLNTYLGPPNTGIQSVEIILLSLMFIWGLINLL